MIMDYFKNLLIGLITGIAAYLNPISGEIKSLIAVFALNFICGLLTALLINHESFLNIKYQSCNTLIQYYKQDSNKLIV